MPEKINLFRYLERGLFLHLQPMLRLWPMIGRKHGSASAEPLCSSQWCAGRSSFPLSFLVGLEFPEQSIFFWHPTLLLRPRVKLQPQKVFCTFIQQVLRSLQPDVSKWEANFELSLKLTHKREHVTWLLFFFKKIFNLNKDIIYPSSQQWKMVIYLSVRDAICFWSCNRCACASSDLMFLSSSNDSTCSLAKRVCSCSCACKASTCTQTGKALVNWLKSQQQFIWFSDFTKTNLLTWSSKDWLSLLYLSSFSA